MAFVVGLRKVKYLQRPKEQAFCWLRLSFLLFLAHLSKELCSGAPLKPGRGKAKESVGGGPYRAVALLPAQAQPPLSS